MRGRVMALWFVVLWGSYPIGSPLMTWVANRAGPRAPLVVCGVAAVASCGIWLLWARHQVHAHEHVPPRQDSGTRTPVVWHAHHR